MPYPHEHAARVREPGDFDPKSFRRKNIAPGIDIIVGKLKNGDGAMVTQTYRFDSSKFTAEEAKAWLKKHNVKHIGFEAATGKGSASETGSAAVSLAGIVGEAVVEAGAEVDGLDRRVGGRHVADPGIAVAAADRQPTTGGQRGVVEH